MCKPAIQAALPVIELIQKSDKWEVHWDYQKAPESSILVKRREYLDSNIHGTLDALEIEPGRVCCASLELGQPSD